MPGDNEEGLEKIHISEMIDGERIGEAMWAKRIGEDLFELRNSPIQLHGLNYMDIVRCGESPGLKPFGLDRVELRSHRTLRIIFTKESAVPTRDRILRKLAEFGITYESSPTVLAYDVPEDVDRAAIYAYVEQMESEGALYWEDVSYVEAPIIFPPEVEPRRGV